MRDSVQLHRRLQVVTRTHMAPLDMAERFLVFKSVQGLHDLIWRMANLVANEQKLSHRKRQEFFVRLGLIKPPSQLDRRTSRQQREQTAAEKRGVRAMAKRAALARRDESTAARVGM